MKLLRFFIHPSLEFFGGMIGGSLLTVYLALLLYEVNFLLGYIGGGILLFLTCMVVIHGIIRSEEDC